MASHARPRGLVAHHPAGARATIRSLVALIVVGGLALVAGVAPAHAHGGEGHGATKPLGGAGAVVIDGYRIELQGKPSPLAVGVESGLVARIDRAGGGLAPVSGGTVMIGIGRNGAPIATHAATEKTWAGSYTLPFTPIQAGAHDVRVVIAELEGRRFATPLTLDFHVDVERAPGLGWPAWTALALTALIGGIGLYAAAIRARRAPAGALNLLEIDWLRRVLTSPAFLPVIQVSAVAVMAAIAVLGFIDVQDGGVNLATKLTWTIWWPGIIFTFVLAGRVWCLACPFGALNEWTSRATGAWRRLPRVFRNLWWATAMFLALTWADEQLGVVRSPAVTAWIILIVGAVAVGVGLLYERRSFCRYLCPIGGLIGIYSMTAPLELRAKDSAVCRGHTEKQCYQGGGGGRGCPMFEFPQALDRNNYCTVCLECAKGCSRDNLTLRLRTFGKDLWAATRRALDEAYLAVALVGLTILVTAQMLSAWPEWVSALARWLPPVVRTNLKPVTYLGLVETVLLFGASLVVGPLLVLAAAVVSRRLTGPDAPGLKRTFVVFGYMFVPIGLAMHLAHNLAHLLLEGSAAWPALQRAVAAFTPLSLGEPDWTVAPLAHEPVVGLLQMAVVVGLFGLSLVAGHRLSLRLHADRVRASRALVPFAVLAFVFTVAGIWLLNQPMGMRHGM
ncbi:MAG: 4Fe-4S binding protein [Candidatus Rokubacteria bacterium]|nr:4Fe-4S binding protein [Candidatus Rokubacteria bacterium]